MATKKKADEILLGSLDVDVIHYMRRVHGTGWRGLDAAFGFKAPRSKERGRRLTGFRTLVFHRKQCGCNV